jgi:hypothetical protein
MQNAADILATARMTWRARAADLYAVPLLLRLLTHGVTLGPHQGYSGYSHMQGTLGTHTGVLRVLTSTQSRQCRCFFAFASIGSHDLRTACVTTRSTPVVVPRVPLCD